MKWAIEKTISYRESQNLKLPIVRVALVVNAYNQHEIYDFIKEWVDIVDYVDIQCLLLGGVEKYNQTLRPDHIGEKVEDFRCNSPWGRMVVRGNGDVIVCENFQGADTVIGNVNVSSMHEIYNSDLAKRLRRDGRDGLYKEPACIECANNVYTIDVGKYLSNPPVRSVGSWGILSEVIDAKNI